ncbi:hypothetical protein V6N11_045619 [Hibiscus sabdariffa]|uniref:Uncharacterized protein n=1 Tax=Hibiscus sabdariffa TaxID=183260 RepID=A0ABR2Q1I0_9ROSI
MPALSPAPPVTSPAFTHLTSYYSHLSAPSTAFTSGCTYTLDTDAFSTTNQGYLRKREIPYVSSANENLPTQPLLGILHLWILELLDCYQMKACAVDRSG